MAERRLFKKLPPRPRRLILGYIEAPSFDSWKAVRDLPVSIGQTLSDLVDILDRCYYLYPDSLLIARASKLAERRDADLEAMEM